MRHDWDQKRELIYMHYSNYLTIICKSNMLNSPHVDISHNIYKAIKTERFNIYIYTHIYI